MADLKNCSNCGIKLISSNFHKVESKNDDGL